MPETLENSAVATGLEKVSFHLNPKERQCQRIFKLPHNCTRLTCWKSNAQNSPSQASTVCELRTFRSSRWIQKKTEEPEIKLPASVGSSKKQEFQKNIYFCLNDYAQAFDCVNHNRLWKILKEMGIPDHLICLLRNLYAGQEATVRTGHGATDWFQIRKRVPQGCILLPCLFIFYAEYIM